MKHKTQVFVSPELDHYRTRLTHTLEVTQIARTVARALRLNEDLAEAIGVGHDMGHAPFGHDGEYALDEAYRRYDPNAQFRHYEQSLRIVDFLEKSGRGLNLTWEVRDGIGRHSKGKEGSPVGVDPSKRSATLEGQIMRVADLIAYVNHDIDDAVRAGVIHDADLPGDAVEVLGKTSSARIARMVKDVVTETQNGSLTEIRMSEAVLSATLRMRAFLFEAVYENEVATAEFKKATGILGGLWERVRERPAGLLDERILASEGLDVAARDFLAGMSDRFAVSLYERLFIPKPWVGPMAWNQL
jgi:dGTPase